MFRSLVNRVCGSVRRSVRHTPDQSPAPSASLIRSLAGAPAGFEVLRTRPTARHARRGSFLVLVVGTLAVLSVFAIIYVTIGNQDARTQAAVAKRQRLDDVPIQFRDYVGSIIANDTVSTFYDDSRFVRSGNGSVPELWREAMDYPFTGFERRSNSTDPSTAFDPTGSFGFQSSVSGLPWTITGGNPWPTAWQPSDPFLASSEPAWLRWSPTEIGQDAGFPSTDRQDWMHISNLAPDGRFVNLVNLRGNFAAEAGTGNDANGNERLSMNLSVLEANGDARNTTWFGAPVNPDIPTHFDSWQRFLFRPTKDSNHAPGDPDFLPNQYGDTDGDGMLDARWFELVESRGGTNSPLSSLLDTDGTHRYFFAARVVDLSSRINVNTATDQFYAPTAGAGPTADVPIGLTPADVDLARLLTLFDTADENIGLSYDSIYNGALNNPAPENYTEYTVPRGIEVGAAGALALRLSHASGEVPALFEADNGENAIFRGDTQLRETFAGIHGLEAPNSTTWDFSANPFDRWSWFRSRAIASGDVRAATGGYAVRGPFGIEDLSELLTRNSVNDHAVTSNLEKALLGRDDTGPGTPPISQNFDPLRSNRGPRVELSLDEDNDGQADSATLLRHSLDPRHRLTTLSGGRALRTSRGVHEDYLSLNGSESKLNIREILSRSGVSITDLFNGYSSVLMPHANASDLSVWSRTSGGFDNWRTAFYGHSGPEVAAYVSGFMALNMADLFDADESPRAYTLVLDDTFRNPAAPDALGQTYMGETDDGSIVPDRWEFPAWVAGRRLDLGSSRLAADEADVTARAVNIFGIENQPFVTQVATFTIYSDSRSDEAAGDLIAIRGNLTQGNDEALYRVVAFQLTNPFGADATLSSGAFSGANFCDVSDPTYPEVDREGEFFYIEYDGRFYKLGQLVEQTYVTSVQAQAANDAGAPAVGDDSRFGQYTNPIAGGGVDITLEGLTIPAGKTIVCYALSQIPRVILRDRIATNDPNLPADRAARRATIQSLIEDAMDQSADVEGAYWIPEFNPADGKINLPGATEFRTLVDNGNATVNLWRTVRAGNGNADSIVDEFDTETITTPSVYWDGATGANDTSQDLQIRNSMANDQLVDRLRATGLDAKLPDGINQVAGTDAGGSDNDGFTITVWSTTMRPADPLVAGQLPRGAFPGYCLEPKYRAGWNVSESDIPASLDSSDFTGAQQHAGDSVATWRNAVTGTAFVTGLAEGPNERSSPSVNARSTAAVPATGDYAANYPEIGVTNDQFTANVSSTRVDRLRVADMLLPWGIGPMQNPVGTGSGINPDLPDPGLPARWTTLAEAMSMVMGYDTGTPDPIDPLRLFRPLPPGPGGESLTILDRGHLRLDGFVSYFDSDTDLIYSPLYSGGDDTPLALGSPMAYGVLDAFTAITPGLDSYTKAQPGTININTAPLTVMRALPMLSPPSDILPTSTPRPWWWWPTGSSLNNTADIAVSLLSFRDKMVVNLRASAAIASGLEYIAFSDFDSSPLPPDNPTLLNGRSARSEIVGVREQPGFQSFGELLGVRYRTDPAGTFLAPGLPVSTDFLGVNGTGVVVNDSRAGVDSVLHKDGGAFFADEIGNEYDEQLSLVNAVAGSTSTRSDYYAVWFVMHGYRESDVTALTDAQPLVPSIARRFVVVYDRTNVTKRGDKPRVVLFKEVPL